VVLYESFDQGSRIFLGGNDWKFDIWLQMPDKLDYSIRVLKDVSLFAKYNLMSRNTCLDRLTQPV
jgi:hypothetical protein